jgi:hypothetical protein
MKLGKFALYLITAAFTVILFGCGVSQEEFDLLQKKVGQLYDRAGKLDGQTDTKVRSSVESAESRLSSALDDVRRRQVQLSTTLQTIQTNFTNVVHSGVAGKGSSSADVTKLKKTLQSLQTRLDRLEKLVVGGQKAPATGAGQ